MYATIIGLKRGVMLVEEGGGRREEGGGRREEGGGKKVE